MIERKNYPVSVKISTYERVGDTTLAQQLDMKMPKLTGDFPTSEEQTLTIEHRHFPPRLKVRHPLLGEEGAEIALPKKNGTPILEARGIMRKGDTKVTIVFPGELHPQR